MNSRTYRGAEVTQRFTSFLNEDERRLITTGDEDRAILGFIKTLDSEQICFFDAYKPLDMDHYRQVQRQWMGTEKHFLGERLHHPPTSLEFIEDMEQRDLDRRFKAFYVLRYGQRVEIVKSAPAPAFVLIGAGA